MSKRHGDPWMAQVGEEEVDGGMGEGSSKGAPSRFTVAPGLEVIKGLPHSLQNLAPAPCGVSHFGHSKVSSLYHQALAQGMSAAHHISCLTRSSSSRSCSSPICLNSISALSKYPFASKPLS